LPDEKVLYVVGGGATPRMIDAYDVIDDGTGLANQRGAISADDKGSADELRVDVDGNLWCGWGTGERLDAVSILNPRVKLIDRDASDLHGSIIGKPMKKRIAISLILLMSYDSLSLGQTTRPAGARRVNLFNDDKIRLIVRADDFGFSHASNMALQRLLDGGVITAASVIVNTGWLDETVEILEKHPQVSVGVHVCLNSEWVPYKWGPVLPAKEVPSIVDKWGHFFGTRKDLLAHQPNLDEVENEIRAQVELAVRKGLKVSYMDHHMGAAVTTPGMRERFVKVAKEKGLGISRWFGEVQGPVVYNVEPARKTEFLIDGLQKLDDPGLYLIVCHTLAKTPEVEVLTDLNPTGPKNMADHRQAELDMLCDPRLKHLLKQKAIELVGYDVLRERFLPQMGQPTE
jgi:chitin disaccharide deacetylase